MIPGWILLLVSVGYVGLLFGVAWLGDRKPLYPRRNWLRPIIYSLALAVYCSSWTFYGAVGTAATTGLGFLPIYLGPILLFLFGWRILERMVLVAREQSTVSIADFLAARYGRAQNIAATVTLIAVIAAIPYIALQFKAVVMSFDVLSGQPVGAGQTCRARTHHCHLLPAGRQTGEGMLALGHQGIGGKTLQPANFNRLALGVERLADHGPEPPHAGVAHGRDHDAVYAG